MQHDECPECARWRVEGCSFCVRCGMAFDEVKVQECPECAYWRSVGARYCSTCGRRLTAPGNPEPQEPSDPPEEEPDTLRYILSIVGAFSIVLIAFTTLAYMLLNIGAVADVLNSYGKTLLALCSVAFIISLAYAVYSTYQASQSGSKAKFVRSGLPSIGICLGIVFVISYVYVIITAAMGNPIDSSGFDRYTQEQLAASFFIAGPREEFLYRLIPIGVPMVVIGYIAHRKGSWKYILGGFGTSRTAWILIIISALIFGFAHLDGWNMAKVPQAALCGIVLGYLYTEYGLYASIMMHACLDCTTISGYLIGGLASLDVLALVGVGILAVVLLIIKVCKEGLKKEPWLSDEPAESFFDIWKRH